MASIVRSTAKRAVYLRMAPRPSSLGESREILRLVSQFGEVEYFKNLKYDTLTEPRAALVVFKDEDAAQHCIMKSPIRFRMGRAPPKQERRSNDARQEPPPTLQQGREEDALDVLEGMQAEKNESLWSDDSSSRSSMFGSRTQTRSLSTSSLPRPPPREPEMTFLSPPPPTPLPSESRIFQLQASEATVNFRDQINQSRFHGGFLLDGKSLAQQDLAKRVPTLGMSDLNWRGAEKPWRIRERELRMEHEGPTRRKSLKEVWEEGQKMKKSKAQG